MANPSIIDPSIIARLNAQYANYRPGETSSPYYVDPSSGLGYQARYGEPTYNGEGSPLMMAPITGYTAGNYDAKTGSNMEVYDTSGKDTGQSEFWKPDSWNYDNLAMMAPLAFAVPFAAGVGAAGAGAAGVAGLPSSADASMFWDMGAAAPNTAAMGASGAGGLGAASAAGATSGGASVNPFQYGFTDSGTAGGALAGGDAYAAGGAGGPGAAVQGLDPSILAGLGKYALPLIGGLLGTQGVKQTQTTTKDIPDWLKPYVLGQGGLLDSANSLMRSQLPIAQQNGQQIMNTGMGLLSRPVAANPFTKG